jgi:hypothetical protein
VASGKPRILPGVRPASLAATLRGYILLVACGGWLIGIWLSLGPLATARPLAWAGLVAVCAGALAVAYSGRLRLAAQARPWRMADSAAQALTFAGLWLAIGGIRGAWDNPAQASDALSRQPAGVSLQVARTVS